MEGRGGGERDGGKQREREVEREAIMHMREKQLYMYTGVN
jgi:hypothetical protein